MPNYCDGTWGDDLGGSDIFRWLTCKFEKASGSASKEEGLRESISIDVSGPEFQDLYPSISTLKSALVATEMFAEKSVDWMATRVSKQLHEGQSYRGALMTVVRSGDLVPPKKLRDLGANTRRKVGSDFVDALSQSDLTKSINTLEQVITTTASSASKLHNIRRYREAGITHCALSSAGDERSTDIERELDGKRMTLDEAVKLTNLHGAAISRSVFIAEVRF